jgi:hypothetical protein
VLATSHDRITGVEPLDRFTSLIRGMLQRTAEPYAACLGPLAAFAGP